MKKHTKNWNTIWIVINAIIVAFFIVCSIALGFADNNILVGVYMLIMALCSGVELTKLICLARFKQYLETVEDIRNEILEGGEYGEVD